MTEKSIIEGPVTPEPQAKRRCTGHCCQKFWLPVKSAEELRLKFSNAPDVEFIADMIIKLPPQEVAADGKPILEGDDQREHWFTCRHYDAATGNCGVYDKRPWMCSAYPYGGNCKYKACTSSCNEERAARDSQITEEELLAALKEVDPG